jgi:hypothetical protein
MQATTNTTNTGRQRLTTASTTTLTWYAIVSMLICTIFLLLTVNNNDCTLFNAITTTTTFTDWDYIYASLNSKKNNGQHRPVDCVPFLQSYHSENTDETNIKLLLRSMPGNGGGEQEGIYSPTDHRPLIFRTTETASKFYISLHPRIFDKVRYDSKLPSLFYLLGDIRCLFVVVVVLTLLIYCKTPNYFVVYSLPVRTVL